jgi:predicted RNA-binding Zn-ribbon protein involved in translation (DUF1610 family)
MPSRLSNLPKFVDTGKGWLGRLRVRAFAWSLGIALATVAVIIFTTVSWVPVVGVAVAACVVTLNNIGQRLSKPTCYGCGKDLTGLVGGPSGIPCPNCGSLYQRNRLSRDQFEPTIASTSASASASAQTAQAAEPSARTSEKSRDKSSDLT